MSREDAIQIEGVVVEAFSQRLYRVEFSNGHTIMAHLPSRRASQAGFVVGDRVTVDMSPFDFSKGRISVEIKN